MLERSEISDNDPAEAHYGTLVAASLLLNYRSKRRESRAPSQPKDLAWTLHELRQARERSQEDLARELKVGQPAVAKLERRADMYVSNLRRYIEALGGTLEITAKFPDGAVQITNFSDLADTSGSRRSGS